MNVTILAAIIAASTTVGINLILWFVRWLIRRGRRKSFSLALATEAAYNKELLDRLIRDYPRDGMASTTGSLLRGLAAHTVSDHLFTSLLPDLDILPPVIIRQLASAHVRLRTMSGRAENVLTRGGSGNPLNNAEVRYIRDDLDMLMKEFDETSQSLEKIAASGQ